MSTLRIGIILLVALTLSAVAHGTRYEILNSEGTAIRATFDDGTPLAKARVLVFAPEEVRCSDTLLTDTNGVFSVAPNRPGTWVLQVRDTQGHGMRINLTVDDELRVGTTPDTSAPGMPRKIAMALCVVLGFVGIALYFRRKGT